MVGVLETEILSAFSRKLRGRRGRPLEAARRAPRARSDAASMER